MSGVTRRSGLPKRVRTVRLEEEPANQRQANKHQANKHQANKHQVKTEVMRRKLLTSARKIFAQDGFEAARLEDIAAHAGHTRGAFYAHFASKEELFFALLEQQIFRHLENVQALVEAQTSPAEKLRVLRESYVKKLEDPKWSILMLEFKLFAIRRPKVRARLAAAHREMRATVQIGGIAELIAAQDSHLPLSYEAMRVVLEALLQCLILQRAYDPIGLSASQAAEALGGVFDLLVCGK